jgi:hypothetical protein
MSFSHEEVSLPMIPDSCIEVHTMPENRPSVPAWFAEVVILARHLATAGLASSLCGSGPLDTRTLRHLRIH